MRTKSAATVCAALATALMALGTTTAGARSLSLSNQNIRITFNDLEFRASEIRNDCHVTLEGSFHTRTFAKVAEALVGYLTRVMTGQCTQGVTLLAETMPWHVRYQGFAGTLPNITTVIAKIFGASFRVSICLASADIRLEAIRDVTTQALIGIEVPLQTIPTSICGNGSLRSNANGSPSVLGSNSAIIVTLI
jgi:hypothetical protein